MGIRRTLEERFWEKVEKSDGCWLWIAAKDRKGYGVIGVGASKTRTAHIVSFLLSGRVLPKGHQVLHKCDVPACVRPDHLFSGTPADNTRDMLNKGREARGVKNGHAKLTTDQIAEIRASAAITQRELAEKYGVDQAAISRIIARKSY